MDTVAALHRYRARYVTAMAALRVLLAPPIWMLRAAMALLRRLELERAVFGWFFRHASSRILRRRAQAFVGYDPTDRDIFVCCDIKSGTNWTLQMAYQIANLGRGRYAHIHDVVAWPDARVRGMSVSLTDDYPMRQSVSGKRVIKTHAQADQVPYSPEATYICVVRDPKDMLVSSWFFIRSAIFGPLMPSPDTWHQLSLSDACIHGRWARSAASYWAWRDLPNVLFLRFEEMKDDLPGTLRRIASHIGVPLTEAQLEQVEHLSSFDYMKSIDHRFYPGRLTPLSLPQGAMIRSGRKGNSKELLTETQQRRVDEHFAAALEALGSDYPYHAFYGSDVAATQMDVGEHIR